MLSIRFLFLLEASEILHLLQHYFVLYAIRVKQSLEICRKMLFFAIDKI